MNSLLCKSVSRNERGGLIAPNFEDLFKDWLYVGHYIDINGKYILKIGTTNNLARRQKEHNLKYKKSPNHTMPPNGSFEYDFWIPLSKYNTLRYEDRNRELWKSLNIGEYIRNDRFICEKKPEFVTICIRKEYIVQLVQKNRPFGRFFVHFHQKTGRFRTRRPVFGYFVQFQKIFSQIFGYFAYLTFSRKCGIIVSVKGRVCVASCPT